MRRLKQPDKLFTLEEANQSLPRLRDILAEMRRIRREVAGLQARIDIEEMTGGFGARYREATDPLFARIQDLVEVFQGLMDRLAGEGCLLKDLEKGLVDFYSIRGGDIVFLCWMEGEERITHWHALQEGFAGRREI